MVSCECSSASATDRPHRPYPIYCLESYLVGLQGTVQPITQIRPAYAVMEPGWQSTGQGHRTVKTQGPQTRHREGQMATIQTTGYEGVVEV